MWAVSGLLIALALAGCAALACQPRTIVIAKKEQRQRVEMVPRGLRTTETGRVEEVRTETWVQTYWVQTKDGTWYPISAGQFEAAQVDQLLEIFH